MAEMTLEQQRAIAIAMARARANAAAQRAQMKASTAPAQQQEAPPLTALAMGTRDVLQGALGGLPGALYDVAALPIQGAIALKNAVTGETGGYLPSGSEYVSRGLEAIGLPESPPSIGKAIRQGVGGAAGGVGLGAMLPATSGVVGAVRGGLTAAPSAQMAAGGAAGAGMEAAKEAGAGPVGQTAAALGAGILGGRAAVRAPKPNIPTTEELSTAASSAYQTADNSGALFAPASYQKFMSDIGDMAERSGLDRELTSNSFRALTRVQDLAQSGMPVSLRELDTLRKVIGAAAGAPNRADRALAIKMRDALDDYVADATPASLVAGDETAINALNSARSLFARSAKSQDIEDIIERADLSASEKSVALRNEFRMLARNKRKMRMFSPEEQAAIKDVVRGRPTTNALQMLGSLGSTGTRKILSGAAGAAAGGPIGAVGALAAESVAQAIANRAAAQQAARVAEFMRSGQRAPTAFQNLLDLSPMFIPGTVLGTTGAIDRKPPSGLLNQ